MQQPREYPFLYLNSVIYVSLMLGVTVVWFCLLGLAESLLFYRGTVLPAYLTGLLFFGGMVAAYLIIHRKLDKLYIMRGTGVIHPDRFVVRLRYRSYDIAFHKVKRMFYKEGKRGRGIIVSARGASLYLEEPTHAVADGVADRESLFKFYQVLELAYFTGRDPSPSGGDHEPNGSENTESGEAEPRL